MKVLKSFLQSLNDEGVGFFVVVGSDPVNLDADEVIQYLNDPEAFQAEYFRKQRQEDDEF